MRGFKQQSVAKWARLALKCGLLLTDTKMWTSIADEMRDRADDVSDEAKRQYADKAERLQNAQMALQGRSNWVGPTMSFLGGVAIGAGVGLLFAPVSGEEARTAVRDKVVDIKNKVGDMATTAADFRSSSRNSAATGTSGY